MLSVLSRHANGRYTGTSAAWSMAKRFLVVWLATWPMLSPVTIPYACSSLAIDAAIRYIIRLQSTQVFRGAKPVSYTHLRAHETDSYLVCRLLLEKKKKKKNKIKKKKKKKKKINKKNKTKKKK